MIECIGKNHRVNETDGAQYLTFPGFEMYPEIRHGFSTRKGGVSEGCFESWNFGFSTGDEFENVRKNYDILARVMGTKPECLVTSAQTHTTNIRVVTEEDMGKGLTREKDFQDVDGLVTNVKGIGIITAHADCTPLFFFDPEKQVIGLAHSGWKGTLGKIGGKMIHTMERTYGCRAENVLVGIGPSLCQDCFEVDEDVAQAFFEVGPSYKNHAYRKGIKHYLNLWRINEQLLKEAGVLPEHIMNMELCTKCHNDVFFSHRGQAGKRGIMAAFMMLV